MVSAFGRSLALLPLCCRPHGRCLSLSLSPPLLLSQGFGACLSNELAECRCVPVCQLSILQSLLRCCEYIRLGLVILLPTPAIAYATCAGVQARL